MFTSLRHWGEVANGTWTLTLVHLKTLNASIHVLTRHERTQLDPQMKSPNGVLEYWELSIYGEGEFEEIGIGEYTHSVSLVSVLWHH